VVRHLVHGARRRLRAQGFTACLGGAESPFRRVAQTERALPPAVTGDLPPDSLFSTSVADGSGRALYRSPITYSSPYHASARLGTEFGDLALRLELRPDVAGRLVIGGIPASPTPLALGLLGLSTLLVVTALLQLRREYGLIAIRSDFVSNVSHELRTRSRRFSSSPSCSSWGGSESDAEQERSLDIIDQEARRLSGWWRTCCSSPAQAAAGAGWSRTRYRSAAWSGRRLRRSAPSPPPGGWRFGPRCRPARR
jgi:signal transduction histidine kinase